jgi:hypothetical protein
MWYTVRMVKAYYVVYFLFLVFVGCAPSNVTPGMTLWAGLSGYEDETTRVAADLNRWPDRQRAAESLKTTYVATMGGSREFNRLVDLDLRRKEFLITLRETSVRPDRVKEMQDELEVINRDVDGLKEIVKGQVTITLSRVQDQTQRIETVAAIGLLSIALDSFSASNLGRSQSAPFSKVGLNTVTDLDGSHSLVQTPDGRTYRCSMFIVPEEGAGISCDPAAAN